MLPGITSRFSLMPFLILLLLLSSNPLGQTAPQSLSYGQSGGDTLAGGELRLYDLSLPADQFLRIVVEEWNLETAVTLVGPDGQTVVETADTGELQGLEPLLFVTETAGLYHLHVRAREVGAAKGRYEVRIAEQHAATAQDRQRVAAQKLFLEGKKLLAKETAEAARAAVEKFQSALPLWRAAGEQREESRTLKHLADAYAAAHEQEKALAYLNQALAVARAVGDRLSELIALNEFGNLYTDNDNAQALEYYNQALALARQLGDRRREAYVLNNLGELNITSTVEAKRQALVYYHQALPIMRSVGDRRGEAHLLNNLGLLYASLSETRTALGYFEQELPLVRALGDRASEAATLNYIGATYSWLGDQQKALDYYNAALPPIRAVGDRETEYFLMRNVGTAYVAMGEYERALDSFEELNKLNTEDKELTAYLLNDIGSVHAKLGDQQKALSYYNQALPIWRELHERRAEGSTLNNIGSAYRALGEYQKALDYYNQALPLKRAVGDRRVEAAILANIGKVYLALGNVPKALDYYQQALALSQATGDRSSEALALEGLSRAERRLGNFAEARKRIEAALTIIEGIRGQIAARDVRSSYFASVQPYYESYIELLMELHRLHPGTGHDAEALQASERARARGLLETLVEAGVDIRQGVDPALLERVRTLQESLNAKAEAQTRLMVGQPTAEQSAAAKKELEEILSQYELVNAQIRASSPRYAALTQPAPLSLPEIQREVLDPNTLLLEYALGDEHSYLWAVESDSIRSYVLPKRAEIETAVRHAYDLLTARNRRIKFETNEERQARVARADAEYDVTAAALSRTLLAPVAHLLGQKRLLLICDGALHYLPFAALPAPDAQLQMQDSTRGRRAVTAPPPLMLKHEIVQAPSVTTLAVLRRESLGRKLAPKTLAVLADPVFEQDDERVRAVKIEQTTAVQIVPNSGAPGADAATSPEFLRSVQESGVPVEGGRIPRLPYTRLEADAITALLPAAERKKALDFDASRATALSAEMGQYRYVHFATHGLLNNAHPGLSGVVLSLVDQHGAKQNGFLRVNEVFNLRLPAEMVVLSGCSTGLGKEVQGEGLVGLTRAFMYAGSQRVLVSLWDVSDRESAALMTNIYRGMLGKERLSPAAALRAAQAQVWRDSKWHAPYYWAAFVLQGEPR